MTTYRYSTERHAMVPVHDADEWPYAKLPPSVGEKKPTLSSRTFMTCAIAIAMAAAVIVVLTSCASTQPAPTTTASSGGITLPTVRKRAPMPPEKRVERVVERTASSATGMAGGAASRAVRVTGNPYVDSLLSGAVRNGVTELRGWWKDEAAR